MLDTNLSCPVMRTAQRPVGLSLVWYTTFTPASRAFVDKISAVSSFIMEFVLTNITELPTSKLLLEVFFSEILNSFFQTLNLFNHPAIPFIISSTKSSFLTVYWKHFFTCIILIQIIQFPQNDQKLKLRKFIFVIIFFFTIFTLPTAPKYALAFFLPKIHCATRIEFWVAPPAI